MQEEKKEPFRIPANDGLPLFPEQGSYVHRKTIVSSFSGILAGLTPAGTQVSAEDFSAVEPIVKENDEPPGAIEWEPASDQEIDPLPGGIDTGSMLHAILEMIPFETVRRLSPNVEGRALLEDPQCDRLIRSRLEHFRIPAHFACKVADLVCDALTCPLPHVEAGFSLCRLDRDNRRHEMEFYYPFSMPQARNPGIPEILKVNGFLMGYIDLVFQHNGKFFIADWKSNRLDRGYHPEALSECMASADYHLQYKIYALATMRWLKLFMKDRFDPEMHFGGVFYFFLRGMGGRNRQGVYFVPGTEVGGIKRLETEIADMLSAISAQVPS
jgi:exodeoxyribonuclease V beta subunit